MPLDPRFGDNGKPKPDDSERSGLLLGPGLELFPEVSEPSPDLFATSDLRRLDLEKESAEILTD
jgi:hypothetical protein